MLDKLKRMISNIDADYVDIRYEVSYNNNISMSSRVIKYADSNSGDGYVLRVLKNGRMSTVCFTREEDIQDAIKTALENSELFANAQDSRVEMATGHVIKDHCQLKLKENPRYFSVKDKICLIQNYSDLLYSQPSVSEVLINYQDNSRMKYYVNNEGTEILNELSSTSLTGQIICTNEKFSQFTYLSFYGNGLEDLRNLDADMIKQAKITAGLLNAEPVKAGQYSVILDPSMTGVFVHEAFGHFSEADVIERYPSLLSRMQIGAKLGSDILNIYDDATVPGQTGFYKYDDEGVRVRRVQIMTNGILTARLHNRITSAKFNEPLTGHNIAVSHNYEPIIRMGNIFVGSGTSSFEELLKKLNNGLYLCRNMGGGAQGDNFSFSANWGYLVENGQITRMIRDINAMGNLFETLKKVVAIGNEYDPRENSHGCMKSWQYNIFSNCGGPCIMVENVTVGGR